MCLCRQISAPLASINWKMGSTVYRSIWIRSRYGCADQYLQQEDSEITRLSNSTSHNDTPGVKRPRREVDYSPSSSAEINNGGAISLVPNTSS
jgi:hypothetical protein